MTDSLANTTLVILAGGEGSRMGRPKGMLTIRGRPILQHILESARWRGPTLLVTSPGRELPPGAGQFDREVQDPVAGLGPMRGVLTALEHSQTEQIVVSPVDMPSIDPEVFRWLAEELHRQPSARAVLIERKQDAELCIEPLPAAFTRNAKTLLQNRLDQGNASLRRLSESSDVHIVRAPEDWPETLWTNLNNPDDLARWESSMAGH